MVTEEIKAEANFLLTVFVRHFHGLSVFEALVKENLLFTLFQNQLIDFSLEPSIFILSFIARSSILGSTIRVKSSDLLLK